MTDLETILEKLRQPVPHYICDQNTWYNCPRSPMGCGDRSIGTECNCGADEETAFHNEVADALETLRRAAYADADAAQDTGPPQKMVSKKVTKKET